MQNSARKELCRELKPENFFPVTLITILWFYQNIWHISTITWQMVLWVIGHSVLINIKDYYYEGKQYNFLVYQNSKSHLTHSSNMKILQTTSVIKQQHLKKKKKRQKIHTYSSNTAVTKSPRELSKNTTLETNSWHLKQLPWLSLDEAKKDN